MTRVSLFLAACSAVLVALALPISCSAAPKGCSPTTCDGCCDSTGACQFGNSQPACGSQGGQCRSCLETESCIGGLCLLPNLGTPSCEESCDGCCRDKVCKSGSDSAACGVMGGACATCTGNQACNGEGRCQNTACLGCIDSSGACQSGQSAAACGAQGFSCVACTAGATCSAGGLCVGGSCDGCRDAQGVCRAGTSRSNCGASGNSCVVCGANQQCSSAGQCVAAPSDGGTGSCNATSCPDGCCAGSACVTRTSASQCGSGGAACVACASNQQCNGNGACQDTGGGSCTATNCASGCCSGNTCVSPPTRSQCGKGGATCSTCGLTQNCSGAGKCTSCSGCIDQLSGVCRAGTDPIACGKGGANCTFCAGGSSCSAGVCKPGSGTGGGSGGGAGGGGGSADDGGLPMLDCAIDGGVPHCGQGSCCGSLLGVMACFPNGTNILIGVACGTNGGFCTVCPGGACTSNGQCQ